MKIARIEAFHIEYEVDKKEGGHMVTPGNIFRNALATVVKVSTDEGICGFAESTPVGSTYMASYPKGIVPALAELGPALIGQDPRDGKKLCDLMDAHLMGHEETKAPVDVACLDIYGKSIHRGVVDILGGRSMDKVPLFVCLNRQHGPEKLPDLIAEFKAKGIKIYQLKAGVDIKSDVARVKKTRELLDDDELLYVDINRRWLPQDTIRFCNQLQGVDFILENPCATLEECALVHRRTSIPMQLDESIVDLKTLIVGYNMGAMEAVNLKASRFGGLTRSKVARDTCEQLGIKFFIDDTWGGDLTQASMLSMAGSSNPRCCVAVDDFVSTVDISLAGDFFKVVDGCYPVPAGPGLGVTIDEKLLGRPVLTVK